LRERLADFAIVITISAITVSPVLWFLQHPIKYPLYIFLICIASLFSLRWLETRCFSLVIRSKLLRQVPVYLGIASSLGLLVLISLGIFGLTNLLLALYVVSFMPGFVVLRVIKLRCSTLETLVLSFGLGVAVTCLFVTPLLHFAEYLRTLIVAIGFSLFSVIPIITEKSAGNYSQKLDAYEQRSDAINVASLVVIVLLFTFIWGAIYPAASHTPFGDILAHWRNSQLLKRSPRVYTSAYPWFHVFQSTIYSLSRPSMAAFTSALAFLSILLVITFYVLANKYLKDVDPRLPPLATIIWFLFSGFGWLHYIQVAIPPQTMSREALLWIVSDRSYWDTLFGQGPWLWLEFRPLTLGFLLLFTLLFLLKLQNLESLPFTLVFSILTIALGLTHIPELEVFIAVLFITSVFAPQLSLRLKEAWLSTFTGLIGISAIVYILSAQGVTVGIPYTLLLFLTFVSFVGYFMASRNWGGIKINAGKGFVKWIRTIVLIVFLAGTLSWLSSAQDFSVKFVGSWGIPSSVFMVPWHLYPVLLGVTGLIFVLGLADIWQALRTHRTLVLFIFMALVALFMGRLISFVNTHLPGTLPYFERRFIPILFASISLLAPIALLKLSRTCTHSWKAKRIICFTMAGLVILAGTSSTFLSIELRNRSVYREEAKVAAENWEAINYLYQAFEEEPNSRIFTITSRSMWELRFAAPRLIVDPLARPLWTAKYPEMPLWILHGAYPAYDPPYIYLHTRDTIELQDKFKGSFMDRATSSIFSTVYKDSVARVMRLPTGSAPSRNSSLALILPYYYDEETAWAYSLINTLLSFGRYNYTTVYELDSRINEKEIIIVPLDDSRIVENLLQRMDNRSDIKMIVFNTDGSNYLAQHFMIGETELSTTSSDNSTTLINTSHPIEGTATLYIRNDKGNTVKYKGLVTDNHTSFWEAAPYGSGNIGLAVLKDDLNFKTEGASGLRIEVGEGGYAQWQIAHAYSDPQNWAMFDFLMFDWYGHNDNKRYVVELYAPDIKNYFWYEFIDNWQGWRRVLIPLDMPEGAKEVFGVQINKVRKGNPSWNNVTTVNIRLSGANPNIEGIWFIDNIGLDVGRWVTTNITISAENAIPIKLSLLDGVGAKTSFTLFNVGEQGALNAAQVYYMDGTRADTIFGSQPVIKASIERVRNQTKLTFSAKMPPATFGYSKTAEFQLWFNIEFPADGGYAVKLASMRVNKELMLPTSVWVPSVSLKNNTQILGWYLGGEYRAPLAARGNISGIEVTYVNIYPLAQALKEAVEGDFNFILSQLIEVIGVNLPKQKDHSPEELLNLLIFNDVSFRGNIALESDSIMFPPSQKVGCFNLHLKRKSMQICNVSNIHINGIEHAHIFTHRMDINKGMGFYSSITFYNSSITMEGVNLAVELLYENGSRKYLEGEREIMMTIPNSVNILVRAPLVELTGEAFFKETYGLQSVFDMLKASGQDVNATGHLEFELLLSDEYNIARKVTIEGVVNRNPPLLQWNELESVKNSILWFIIAALIVLPLSLMKKKLRNIRKIKFKIRKESLCIAQKIVN